MKWWRQFSRLSRRTRLVALVLLTVLGLVITITYGVYRLDLEPLDRSATATTAFTVTAGQNAPTIATALQSAGLIRDRNSFITYVNFHALRAQLKSGAYALKPSMSVAQIAETIAGGRTLTRRLVIPEGFTVAQIGDAMSSVGLKKADFEAALAEQHTPAFLTGKPANVSLEGYLFPDSYTIQSTTTASQLVALMLQTFGERVGAEYVQAFARQGLSLHQGLTLASIVEREVSSAADRPVVAQIFLKRLKAGQTLGSDVTAVYAAKLLGVPFSVDVNSPYNTRRFPGLPPGPICNPGLSALDAVAQPAATDYLYFLSGKDGKTYFAKTYAEHQQNIAKYLN